MARLAVRWPGYGWEHNVGYATEFHRDALLRLGPTRHHRADFASVRQLTLDLRSCAPEAGRGFAPVPTMGRCPLDPRQGRSPRSPLFWF